MSAIPVTLYKLEFRKMERLFRSNGTLNPFETIRKLSMISLLGNGIIALAIIDLIDNCVWEEETNITNSRLGVNRGFVS